MHTDTGMAGERTLEAILRDPLVRLAMASDGVSDAELRPMLRRMQLAVLRRAAGRQRIEDTAPSRTWHADG